MSSKDKPDLSGYSEMWTRPKRVFVKRLTRPKDFEIVVNGLPSVVTAPSGSFEVVRVKVDGSLLRKEPSTEEQVNRRYGAVGPEGDLFANVHNDEDEAE